MPLNNVEYEELRSFNCAMLDATSLQILCDPAISSFLFDTRSRLITSEALPQDMARHAQNLNHALDILARMAAYEFVVADKSVFERVLDEHNMQSATPLGDAFVRLTDIPQTVYRAAANSVLDAVELIRADPMRTEWLHDDALYEPVERRHIEDCLEDPMQLQWLRYSNQSAMRAFVYVEFARLARIPLFVSREKQVKLRGIGWRFAREALSLVQTRVDRAVFKEIYAAAGSPYGSELLLEWPPLVRYILSVAYRHEISLYEAMLRIRQVPAAEAFRKWLGQLQRLLLNEGSSSSLMQAEDMLRQLALIADHWSAECGSAYGVRYRTTTANLSAIPGVGTVLKILGRETVAVKDPIINRGVDYLTFLSEWYAPIQGERAG